MSIYKIDEVELEKAINEWFKTANFKSENFLWTNKVAKALKSNLIKYDRWRHAPRGLTKKPEPEPPKVEPIADDDDSPF